MTVKDLIKSLSEYPDDYQVRSFITVYCPYADDENCLYERNNLGHEKESGPAALPMGSEIVKVSPDNRGASVLLEANL